MSHREKVALIPKDNIDKALEALNLHAMVTLNIIEDNQDIAQQLDKKFVKENMRIEETKEILEEEK